MTQNTSKKIFSKNFVISNGSYNENILVSVGTIWEDINIFAKQYNRTKKDITLDKQLFDGKCDGFFDDESMVLWLRSWNNKEYDYDVLRHECHHVAQILLGQKRGMNDELEALAYQQDYLIDTIRKELKCAYKDWRKELPTIMY